MEKDLVAITALCSHYEIELSFIDALRKTELIQLIIIDEEHFIHQDQIRDLEKMIRLHHELEVNIEGIDVVFNLLEKEKELREELNTLRNKLRFYEHNYLGAYEK